MFSEPAVESNLESIEQVGDEEEQLHSGQSLAEALSLSNWERYELVNLK